MLAIPASDCEYTFRLTIVTFSKSNRISGWKSCNWGWRGAGEGSAAKVPMIAGYGEGVSLYPKYGGVWGAAMPLS